MRIVYDVQHSEGDRDSNAHRGVEAGEQEPRDERVGEERPGHEPLLAMLVVRMEEVARFPARRPEHDLVPGLLPFLEAVAADTAILDVERTAFGPFAVLGEADVAHDGR